MHYARFSLSPKVLIFSLLNISYSFPQRGDFSKKEILGLCDDLFSSSWVIIWVGHTLGLPSLILSKIWALWASFLAFLYGAMGFTFRGLLGLMPFFAKLGGEKIAPRGLKRPPVGGSGGYTPCIISRGRPSGGFLPLSLGSSKIPGGDTLILDNLAEGGTHIFS